MKLITILLIAACTPLAAQWLNYPDPRTPRNKDGSANLSAPPPRLGGKPDLSGVWQAEYSRPGEIERLFGDVFKDFVVPGDDPRTFSKYFIDILADFKPEEAPMRPEAAALLRKNSQSGSRQAPSVRCVPQGIPSGDLDNYLPFKVIQTPEVIAVLYEESGTYRQIYTDGRKLPVDPQPAWMGYSVGRWEGDTLVVDSIGFKDQGWLDGTGHPQSGELRVRERFHRRDFGHMELELTIDDPKMYTKPFTVRATEVLIPDSDVLEYVCAENEKDSVHLK